MIDKFTTRKVCQVESGLREYDCWHPSPNAYGDEFECIGKGKIHSINGTRQIGRSTLHFFKLTS